MARKERILGCLLAGACGDALGYPVEFGSGDRIREEYGENGVRDLILQGGKALITDDTQMTLFTAEGMLNASQYRMAFAASVYQSYLDWLNTQGFRAKGYYYKKSRLVQAAALRHRRAPGLTCMSALDSGDMGTLDEPINTSKGCGGVMRTAPCGMMTLLPGAGDDAWALQGAQAAAITHSHLMGYVPAAMLADMIHSILLEDGRGLEAIVRDSLQRVCRMFGPDIASADGCEAREGEGGGSFAAILAFRQMIGRAIALAKTDTPAEAAIGQLGEGWVGDEALAIAVYCCLKYPDNLVDCLCAAVNHGGDSDSTGAIAGNILGAWLGVEAIPARWLQVLEARELIEMMACAMAQAE